MNDFTPMPVETAKARIPVLTNMLLDRPSALLMADLGSCYFTIGESEVARPLLEKAWDKNKTVAAIGQNLALVYKDLGMHKESFKVTEEAYINGDQEDVYLRLGYQEALLKQGFWDRGWALTDTRPTQKGAAFDLRLPITCKKWRGEELPKDHLLIVINEGGFGDRINYVRWLPILSEMGINWKLYPYAPQIPFFKKIFPSELLLEDGTELTPDPTHWTTTFGLPQDLNARPTNIPEPIPIIADDDLIERYKINRTDDVPIIGICYSAGEQHQGGRKVRSLTEGQAMRIVTSTMYKVRWVNLQWREKMPYPVNNFLVDTWPEFAGLIHHLDGVVSVDTGTYHMAGCMGKKTAVLLSGNSCWKFGMEGSKDPWYPTSTLYRNKGWGLETAVTDVINDINSGKLF